MKYARLSVFIFFFGSVLWAQNVKLDTIKTEEDDYLRCIDHYTNLLFYLKNDEFCTDFFNKEAVYKIYVGSNEYFQIQLDKDKNIEFPLIMNESIDKTKYYYKNGEAKLFEYGKLVLEVARKGDRLQHLIFDWSKTDWYSHFIDKEKWLVGETDAFKSGKVELYSDFLEIKQVNIYDDQGVKRIDIDVDKKQTLIFDPNGNLREKRLGSISEPKYEDKTMNNEYSYRRSFLPLHYLSEFVNRPEPKFDLIDNEIWIYDAQGNVLSHFYRVEKFSILWPNDAFRTIKFYDISDKEVYKEISYYRRRQYNKRIVEYKDGMYRADYLLNDSIVDTRTGRRVYEASAETGEVYKDLYPGSAPFE